MAKQVEGVKVNIMGRDYVVTCSDEEREGLLAAASYLDKQMRVIQRSGKLLGHERCAVMAALNISHELLAQRQQEKDLKSQAGDGETAARLARLQQKIDSVLQEQRGGGL